jgi:TonB family protein
MYLDFEDYRPETPRVPTAISRREGILLSLIAHGLMLAAVLYLPGKFMSSQPEPDELVVQDQRPVEFIMMSPRIERPAPPKLQAPHSDLDRRSTAPLQAPRPDNTMPFSRGNTSEKVIGSPEEKAAGPESPTPSPASSQPPAEGGLKSEAPVLPPAPSGGSLGASLRNLQRYLEDQNYDNPQGLGEQDPDIQFDSKGVEFGPWLRRFVAQVKRNWFIPQAALFQRGRVVLQFYVLKNGTIIDVRVVQPSSIDAFTVAAVNAIKMSNPTAALPPEYPVDRAFFTVTFHYNERGGG